ncbi:MAG: 4Fe-4S dicluster domain-containing protein [Cyanobacteria bacterium SIG29]|nr:4Fe-4S dicluster domain-containing protein [Cyanobacteria bacterium SIG29]
MGRIVLDRDKCKACYLCVDSCPNKVLEIDKTVNALGYYPVKVKESAKCVGCAICARVCPDLVIEKVYR